MKKIDKAIMLLRSIPEDKLDEVIDLLTVFSVPVKQTPSKPGSVIDFFNNSPEDSRE